MSKVMSEERLKEIEYDMRTAFMPQRFWDDIITECIAEIRKLRQLGDHGNKARGHFESDEWYPVHNP